MGFSLKAVDSGARAGVLKTASGKISTPFFMPVETKGAAKFVSQQELLEMGFEAIISNALLLYFKPGLGTIGKIHSFLQWPKSIFTDSGGFQVISKHFLHSISDKGALFKNPFDGRKERISPEKAIEIQNQLGSDIAMCLDHQPLHGTTKKSVAEAVQRTNLWAARCKKAHKNPNQLLFGICQGGLHQDLRKKSFQGLEKIGFDGYAVGGFGIGEPAQKMLAVSKKSASLMPVEKPRYLMGIGSPRELVEAVSAGFDCFDSCFPTRMGRHGLVFASTGSIRLEKTVFAKDQGPLDMECGCFVCKNHSRSYLHHLLKLKEPSGLRYLSHHNLYFLSQLMKQIRASIKEDSFARFRKGFLKQYH